MAHTHQRTPTHHPTEGRPLGTRHASRRRWGSSPALAMSSRMRCRTGTPKASVLPEPVWAAARMQAPSRAGRSIARWMGVGCPQGWRHGGGGMENWGPSTRWQAEGYQTKPHCGGHMYIAYGVHGVCLPPWKFGTNIADKHADRQQKGATR